MARSIRKLGLVGATLAFLLIAGLNFTALNRQWEVPYIGVQRANAWGPCVEGYCPIGEGTRIRMQPGCWGQGVEVVNPCAPICRTC